MITFREIVSTDNKTLAEIIRKSLESVGLNIPGTVYTDPTTDQLYELFRTPGSVYFVAHEGDKILGGCGIFPTKGLPAHHAELVKLYLRLDERGKGTGRKLMEKCIQWASENGYKHLYLETFAELSAAVGMYRSLGFKDLKGPMGDSGHHACPVWMLKDLVTVSDFDSQSPEYKKSLRIREDVFIDEQQINRELELEYENDCRYFLVSVGDKPAVTGRLRPVKDQIKFERIATRKEFRGQGLGLVLMKAMTDYAAQNFPGKIPWMHAQMSAAPFYDKAGWTRVGEIFVEADIPHVAMTFSRPS